MMANTRFMAWRRGVLLLLVVVAGAGVAASDRALAEAVKNRDWDTARALVQQRVDVNTPQPDGATALHWAAHWNNVDTATLLIDAGAKVNAANDLGITPLYLACVNASAPMVQTLLLAGADANSSRPTGETALMTCSRTGSVDAVKALLASGADVEAKEAAHSQTALMWAAAQGHADVVRELVEHGADLHASTTRPGQRSRPGTGEDLGQALRAELEDPSAFTPLLLAVRNDAQDVVRVLLAHGADINQAASDGTTPLLTAVYLRHWKLAHFLLEHGADPNPDAVDFAPLHWAAGSWETDISGFGGPEKYQWIAGLGPGKLELVQALLAHGADPNARIEKAPPRFGYVGIGAKFNLRGATPFFLAVMGGHLDIARALLAAGADPWAMTDDRTTPLSAVAGLGHLEGMSLLSREDALKAVEFAVELGADVSAINSNGDTALHGAAEFGADGVVRFLVERGGDVNAINNGGMRPLTIAQASSGGIRRPRDSTAALLRELGGMAEAETKGTITSFAKPCPEARFVITVAPREPAAGEPPQRRIRPVRIATTPRTVYTPGGCAELATGSVLTVVGARELLSGPIEASEIVVHPPG